MDGDFRIMRDHDEGQVFGTLQADQGSDDVSRGGAVEIARGFIRQQNLGGIGQRTRNADALLLSA